MRNYQPEACALQHLDPPLASTTFLLRTVNVLTTHGQYFDYAQTNFWLCVVKLLAKQAKQMVNYTFSLSICMLTISVDYIPPYL